MKRIQFLSVAKGELPKRWAVLENDEIIGTYHTLAEAIDSDKLTIPYCPLCFLNADDCVKQVEHLEFWKW